MVQFTLASGKISIHALREEGDKLGGICENTDPPFLSTPSARRATVVAQITPLTLGNFYPRPPRGGRHGPLGGLKNGIEISIHALREEGDVRK